MGHQRGRAQNSVRRNYQKREIRGRAKEKGRGGQKEKGGRGQATASR